MDEAKRKQIQDSIDTTLSTFSETYVRVYKEKLIEKCVDDLNEGGDAAEEQQLKERPASTEPVRTGYLVKQGEIVKNWKKRFFVVRADYVVEYYENEDKFKAAAKPKGTMRLNGYKVSTDPNQSALDRLKKIYAQLKMDEEPADAKAFKPYTFEIAAEGRRNWYIQCADQQELDSWSETFKTVCRRAPGLSNDDPVAAAAFDQAVRETRWALGKWGWWDYGGTEEEVLGDLVCEQLMDDVMGDVFDALPGGGKIKRMARDKVEGVMRGMVTTAVGVAWKAAAASVIAVRPTLEKGVKSAGKPVVDAQNGMVEKMKDKTAGKVGPALERIVSPILPRILDVVASPVHNAYSELFALFKEQVDGVSKASASGGLAADATKSLAGYARYWWNLYRAYVKIRELIEPLGKLGDALGDVSPWSFVSDVEDKMEKIMDNALYTFEDDLRTAAAADGPAATAAIAAAYERTVAKFQHDAFQAMVGILKQLLLDITLPPFRKEVVDPCMEEVQPMEDTIPDAVKDFVSVQKCLGDYLEGTVEDVIDKALEPSLEKWKF